MQVCPNCGSHNRPGVVFCDNCGVSLIGETPLATKSFVSAQTSNLQSSTTLPNPPSASKAMTEQAIITAAVEALGSNVFKKGTILRIVIEGREPILLKPKQETVFGRRDPATGTLPDVDMTPFAGYRMGVSRKHALIRQGENDEMLNLWDLGSSNGTFLNGTRLVANRPYGLRDGDEIRLGQLTLRIYYQAVSKDEAVAAPKTNQATPSDQPNNADQPKQP